MIFLPFFYLHDYSLLLPKILSSFEKTFVNFFKISQYLSYELIYNFVTYLFILNISFTV